MQKYLSLFIAVVIFSFFSGNAGGYETVEVKNGATLKGVVKFKGSPPAEDPIVIDRDIEFCGRKQKSGKYLIKNSRLKNVVVWIEDVKKGKALPEKSVNIRLKDCKAEPLVSIGFVGGKYRFSNEDEILHTIQLKLGLKYHEKVSGRKLKDGATIYNLAMPKKGTEIIKPIRRYHRVSENTGYITIRSNTHNWIRGYVFIFDHPYAAVTGDDGTFVIEGLLPGEYLLEIWHEGLGLQEKRINLKPGETKGLEIEFSGGGGMSLRETTMGPGASAERGAPSVVFKEKRFRFGTVREGDIVSHNFEFVNRGNGVLKVVDLIPA
jgi:hypothetical protein